MHLAEESVWNEKLDHFFRLRVSDLLKLRFAAFALLSHLHAELLNIICSLIVIIYATHQKDFELPALLIFWSKRRLFVLQYQ